MTGALAAIHTQAKTDEKRNCWDVLSRIVNCMGPVLILSARHTSTMTATLMAQKDHPE